MFCHLTCFVKMIRWQYLSQIRSDFEVTTAVLNYRRVIIKLMVLYVNGDKTCAIANVIRITMDRFFTHAITGWQIKGRSCQLILCVDNFK